MHEDTLVLEGIVTTLDDEARPCVSPMGPIVDRQVSQFTLRPYQTSRTYRNLKRHPEGVFHVTDDVELLARAAIGAWEAEPPMRPAAAVRGWILDDVCRWFAFRVRELDDKDQRTTITCEIVAEGRQRDFLGFNRAKHAVVEAAILATRTDFLSQEHLMAELDRLQTPIQKTAGEQERAAFGLLVEYVRGKLGEP